MLLNKNEITLQKSSHKNSLWHLLWNYVGGSEDIDLLAKTLMENYLLNFSVISRSIAKIFLVELSKRKLLYSQNELFNYETVEWIIQSRKITELLSSRGHGHSIDAWSNFLLSTNITRVQHESFYKITPVAKNKFIKIYWEKNSLNFHQK